MGHSSGASAKERYFLQDMRYFKVTLNPALEIDQHAIPKVGDIFATLARVNYSSLSICPKLTNNCCWMKSQPCCS